MKQEWKKLIKNPKILVILFIIQCIPIIYTSVFVGSMWDPYGNTEELPVAVVNNDEAATFGEETVQVGQDTVDELKENDKFDWHFVSEKEAEEGLENGDYFLTVTIPKTFSSHAVTVFDETPEEPQLTYNTNPGYSMTGEIIAGRGSRQVTDEVSQELQSAYTDVWSTAITDMRDGLTRNEEKLATMEDRLKDLQAASEELTSGLQAAAPSVASKAGQLSTSISELKEGIRQLKEAQGDALQETSDLNLAEANTSTFLEPIQINEESMTEVENYGSGFTPYILSISLFIGAIAFHVFYKTNDMLEAGMKGWTGKFSVVLFQGVMQALIAAFVLDFLMHVEVGNTWMFYGMTVATSLTFMMAVTLFVSAFGNIGRFLAVLLLVLQIGTSAGTFPIELSGTLFQKLHEFSPMTYSIKGLREAMFDFTGSVAPSEIFLILGGLSVLLTFLWFLVFRLFQKRPALYEKIQNAA
ncbi:YhgE/Pip domain-containing protein [Salimicrobium halophilum]|uniref:YhgE/Pip N-terminal domain-containing protein/YhgE/Pip C-terminal domain-containing protein n=1 Tax=Salimicrobium halophilum TaxID=86666 RepID=A0A1G8T125_9BACI|nr:YhgE/Pip family protein [Salimicrobium halophilum]SDJ35208.1 YhgE/Pip N-terminal domain-containing protein/YhgE/Pip C-terminal domain-containing protein [Salimicrobium halophilum]